MHDSDSESLCRLRLLFFPVLLQLLSWWQDVRSKAQGKQLAHGPHNVFAFLVEHEDGCLEVEELSKKLPTHSTRRAKIVDIGGDTNGFEGAEFMALNHSGTESYALSTSANGVGSILDVCAYDDGGFGRRRLVQQKGCADAEERVWT